jgi:hypothetical protein
MAGNAGLAAGSITYRCAGVRVFGKKQSHAVP